MSVIQRDMERRRAQRKAETGFETAEQEVADLRRRLEEAQAEAERYLANVEERQKELGRIVDRCCKAESAWEKDAQRAVRAEARVKRLEEALRAEWLLARGFTAADLHRLIRGAQVAVKSARSG